MADQMTSFDVISHCRASSGLSNLCKLFYLFVNRREGPVTTVTEVLETEQIKRSIIKTKLHHEKPDYASSAKFIRKLKSILGSLNNAKN